MIIHIYKNFMGKDWDKALPPVSVWRECYRVLKPGAFAFIMATPRQDLLSKLIYQLSDLRSETELFFKCKKYGFKTGFTSIYWTYAEGFKKSANTAKKIDKRLGFDTTKKDYKPITPEAKEMEGSYLGFQPKPALEPIVVVQKPIIFKNMISQAQAYAEASLKGQTVDFAPGVTYLDNGRIPVRKGDKTGFRPNLYDKTFDYSNHKTIKFGVENKVAKQHPKGRFPANLLVQDNCLDTGLNHKSSHGGGLNHKDDEGVFGFKKAGEVSDRQYDDEGDFSRYYDLDYWFEERIAKYMPKTFPFIYVPKPSQAEKNLGTEQLEKQFPVDFNKWTTYDYRKVKDEINPTRAAGELFHPITKESFTAQPKGNNHPTVKSIKLGTYIAMLGTKKGDTILDPFMGSGSFGLAACLVGRKFIGIEMDDNYMTIAKARFAALDNYKQEIDYLPKEVKAHKNKSKSLMEFM